MERGNCSQTDSTDAESSSMPAASQKSVGCVTAQVRVSGRLRRIFSNCTCRVGNCCTNSRTSCGIVATNRRRGWSWSRASTSTGKSRPGRAESSSTQPSARQTSAPQPSSQDRTCSTSPASSVFLLTEQSRVSTNSRPVGRYSMKCGSRCMPASLFPLGGMQGPSRHRVSDMVRHEANSRKKKRPSCCHVCNREGFAMEADIFLSEEPVARTRNRAANSVTS